MKEFTKAEIIDFGARLAKAGLIAVYPSRSHSHNVFSLLPQTSAQFDWLRRTCGTTANVCILHPAAAVLDVCPELAGCVRETKSGKFCRIILPL